MDLLQRAKIETEGGNHTATIGGLGVQEQIYEPRVGCLDRLARETDGQWLKRALLKILG